MKLYKYCSINENFHKILEKNKLYFAKPSEFNDPYDSHFKLSQNTLNALEFNESYSHSNYIESVKQMVSILCLSVSKDNLLLWAHYSDEHKGICLEFEIDQSQGNDPFFDAEAKRDFVNYEADMYEIDITINPSEDDKIHLTNEMFNAFCTKHTDWEYEEEYRYAKPDFEFKKTGMPVEFPPECLKTIILGSKCTQSFLIEALVDKYNSKHDVNVKVKQASISPTAYKVEIH